jgi:hypothetical protein
MQADAKRRWKVLSRALTFIFLLVVFNFAAYAQDRTQAELRFEPSNSAEKNAGVWVDGNYMGCVKEMKGGKTIRLLPGKHEIVVRQAWYQDDVEEAFLEPGAVFIIKPSLVKISPGSTEQPNLAELKIAVVPSRAAVFLDGQYAGHSDEFDGPGHALLIPPGNHKLTVALPGYIPYETALNLRPSQKVQISTTLAQGSGSMAGSLVSPESH